jgi:two-component system, OmpR family, sensor histidine kinase MtrB
VRAGTTLRAEAASLWSRYRSWLARLGAPAVRAVRSALRRFADRWRRSLQLRVTTATLLLCAVVLTILGYVLMQSFVAGLYANKYQSSQNVANQGLNTARSQPFFSAPPNQSSSVNMRRLVGQLETDTSVSYEVYVTLRRHYWGPPVFSSGAEYGFYGNHHPPALPASLVRKVADGGQNGPLQSAWLSLPVGSSSQPVAGLAFGAQLGNAYSVYYFFPLEAEQQSIASMQRTMLLAGIAVLFLLAAIAWLVTRWVVAPARRAAQGARRLSAGMLNERMEVRGTDELAALASSFNEMAASLQDKLEKLEDLSKVQRQFVSDVSHELRTPLTTIRLASDVLFAAREQLPPYAATSAELMQGQLERFESLLTDLLEISRYDANAATLDAEPVDVCAIVLQSADVAQQLAERCGAKIEFRLPAEPCIAEVDRRRVERILRNLLVNAVEHGENRGVIVTAAIDSAAVAVSVRDMGVGLAPGEEQLVFDRFWRADPARARSTGGTGLGLAIALEDARLHGGWLEAWGERGRGSVFRLTLPRAVGDELHGSPLPLSPYQAGLDETELPGFGILVTPNAVSTANGSSGEGASVDAAVSQATAAAAAISSGDSVKDEVATHG